MNKKEYHIKFNISKGELLDEIKSLQKSRKFDCEFLENRFIIASRNKGDFQIIGTFKGNDTLALLISSKERTKVLNKAVFYGILIMLGPLTIIAVFLDENLFLIEKILVVIFFIIVFLLMPIIIKLITYIFNFDAFVDEMNYIVKKIIKLGKLEK